MKLETPADRAHRHSVNALTKQRDDAQYDAEALRHKLKRVEASIAARVIRAPAARAYLATLLEIIRD